MPLLFILFLVTIYINNSNCSSAVDVHPLVHPSQHKVDEIVENVFPENDTTKTLHATAIPHWNDPNQRRFGVLHTLEKLAYWATKEDTIYKALSERFVKIHKEVDLISKYMKDYENSSGKALEAMIKPSRDPKIRGQVIGSNAVLGHLMTYRYATIVDPLRNFLKSVEYRDIQDNAQRVLDITCNYENSPQLMEQWPNENDLYTSHTAILKMNEVYGFRPEQFFHGITSDTTYGGVLQARHCANIGIAALETEQYYLAIEWLELAHTLILSNNDSSISNEIVENMLDKALEQHNNLLPTLQTFTESTDYGLNFYMEPTYKGEPQDQRIRRRTAYYSRYAGFNGNQSDVVANFLGLCSGHNYQPLQIKSTLRCYLEWKLHPYLLLNPVKIEQLSQYPYIVQMHNILGNETLSKLYANRGEMLIAGVAATTDAKDNMNFRSSSGTFLDENNEFAIKIRKLTERITGLVFESLHERLHVVEYTYGRYYGYHSDAISLLSRMSDGEKSEVLTSLEILGNRLATVLYYVEEPEIGGYTSFCEVGTYANAVKGSAIFWLNLHKNGTVRNDVTHAACPIIHGHKIVLNQWIRYHSNFRTFKCSLNQWE